MKQAFLSTLLLSFLAIGCGDDDGPSDGAAEDATSTSDASEDATPDGDIADTTLDATDDGIEVRGTWDTSFSMVEEITNAAWATAAVVTYDNDANFAITQNPIDAGSASSEKFNKIEWTEIDSGVFHYCTVDFDLDTLADAESTTKTADKNELTSGCGGFAWTEMTRQ